MPPTKEEIRSKADATRLKNLRIRLAKGPSLNEREKKTLRKLEEKLRGLP